MKSKNLMEMVIKSILKGIGWGIGFVVGVYICSHIYLFGLEDSIRNFVAQIGQMFTEMGGK